MAAWNARQALSRALTGVCSAARETAKYAFHYKLKQAPLWPPVLPNKALAKSRQHNDPAREEWSVMSPSARRQ